MPNVAIDARDALLPVPHGSGVYVRQLIPALRARDGADGLDYSVFERGGRGPELLWEQLALPRRARACDAAVVHSPNCFLPLRRPCPGVVTVHDLTFIAHPDDLTRRTGWKYRTIAPRAARSAERVICVSTFTRDDVCARFDVDPGKVRVIPLAPALARGTLAAPSGPYILCVGDLRPKKNLLRLIEAFRVLRREGLPHRLVLAGADCGEGASLRAAAGDYPVELPGYVDDARIDALMRGADLFVHPSLYEGFGLVVVEAMARDCPVALADATALPETAGDAAVRFDPLDSADIASAIRRVLEDEALRAELVQRGRRRVAALSWAATAAATAAVYSELV